MTPGQVAAAGQLVSQTLLKHERIRRASTLNLYMPLGNEVDLSPFIYHCLANGISLYVPCLFEESYLLRQLLQFEAVTPNRDGVYEPTIGDFISDYSAIDVSLVPGVAFDLKNNRMGRGGGHYDRLLATIPSYKIGLCYDFQMIDSLTVNTWDVPMDEVISVSPSLLTLAG